MLPPDISHLHCTGILGSDNRYVAAILTGLPGDESSGYAREPVNEIVATVFRRTSSTPTARVERNRLNFSVVGSGAR